MGLVLWIDQNSFATGLLEKVFKKRELPFYTVKSVEDFSYLVEDLRPALIVLDEETYLKHPEQFISQYNASELMQKTPFILLDFKQELPFLKNKIGELKRPIDPFKVPEQLSKFLSFN